MHIENIIRKLDLVTLTIFQSVCDEKSLSKAAEKNMIALSAASKRLTDLEHLIGTKLFIRDGKGMQITPAGESLLYHCRTILDSVYKASVELEEYKVLMNPLMILVKIIKLRWIHILSYDQM
ncbi:LysR family transcriptional regulator, partial [Acinetobacter baumannii]